MSLSRKILTPIFQKSFSIILYKNQNSMRGLLLFLISLKIPLSIHRSRVLFSWWQISVKTYRPWSFKPVTDITGWYFFPVILFLSFPDKSSYSASINWSIGNALMKPITNYKWQEQDYRKKMSACNVSYRLKRSGP